MADLREAAPDTIWHWYDLICPFCYVARDRNRLLARGGFTLIELPFEAHPEIPPAGVLAGPRSSPSHAYLEREAAAAGLPLDWPPRLPNSRHALAAAEWVRRHAKQAFPGFQAALFAAHFAHGEDIGDAGTLARHAAAEGVDVAALQQALTNGSALANVTRSEHLARRHGVHGTPAWVILGTLVSGLRPRDEFAMLLASRPRREPRELAAEAAHTRLDALLDEALAQSFPASDPTAITVKG
ncbi:Predicted dithiol-disulfide isomerase, DsbA family [Rhizobiales bacterium GAS191]|jgi:predicted DsbA family dithiol-disulfide isomerase|nr:Predicted dithiol-disulfide isomerase, DsbA family [Rhizobiales bacterium GAS113]SEC02181.1 Predicted dithiol-disulfide isomerase, DsbA family [Rhizobiales bacterium GAS191]